MLEVFEMESDDKRRSLGVQEFYICPRVNESIILSSPMGDLDFYCVTRIEHNPTSIDRTQYSRDPSASIFVKFESRFCG